MTRVYNKTIIIGRIEHMGGLCKGKGKNSVYIKFDITNSNFKNGEEIIDHHSITAYNKEAETIKKYLHIGDLCCIEGTFDNETKSINAERVVFLRSKKKEELEIPKEINTL